MSKVCWNVMNKTKGGDMIMLHSKTEILIVCKHSQAW